MSCVTVPTFGLGISPRGPSTRPSLPTTPIMSGVASTRSNSSQPSLIRAARSSPPTASAPASRASRSFSPFANTITRTALPVPCGSETAPRTFWSAWRGSTDRLNATSAVSSNFARLLASSSVDALANG